MRFPHAITIANHSALKSLKNLIINFANLMRPAHNTHAVEDDEFDPSPSLVHLPAHITSKSIHRDRLPVVEYEHRSGCAVCLSEIEGGDSVRVLGNCEHAFHADCLDSWVDHGHATCPLCRADLVSSLCGKDPWRSERMVYLFGEDCLMEHLS